MKRASWMVVALASQGCGSGAYWEVNQKALAYQLPEPGPVTLYVVVSDQVNNDDSGGGVLTAVEAVESALRAAGRRVRIVPARSDEPAPLPRVELEFQDFSGGDRVMRGVLGSPLIVVGQVVVVNPVALAADHHGTGRIVIDCYVLPGPDATPTFAGRVRGFVTSGADNDSAEAAGELIAKAILRRGGS